MSLNVSSSGGGSFELVPEGVYVARCFKIIDLGTQWIEWAGQKKEQKKVLITWELLDDEVKMKDGRPYAATKQYTASLDERGRLRPDLEAWRGKKFTDAELASFDLKAVLGAYCQIQIVHSEDGKFANVNAIMATKSKPAGVNPLVSFDIDEPDMAVYETFSDKMKEKIEAAPEFRMFKRKTDPHLPIIDKADEKFPDDEPSDLPGSTVEAVRNWENVGKGTAEKKEDVVIDDFTDQPINLDDIPF